MAQLANLTDAENTKALLKNHVRTVLTPALERHYFQATHLAQDLKYWWDLCERTAGKDDLPSPDQPDPPDESDYLTEALLTQQARLAENYYQKLGTYLGVPEANVAHKQIARGHLNAATTQMDTSSRHLDSRAAAYRSAWVTWQTATADPARRRLTLADSADLRRLHGRLAKMVHAYNNNRPYGEPLGELTRACFRASPERFTPTRHYYRRAHGGEWPMYFFEYEEVRLEAHLHYDAERRVIEQVILKVNGEATGQRAMAAQGLIEHLTTTYPFNWDGQVVDVARPPINLLRR